MPLSKKILLLLCYFSATSSWLVAFPGFDEADLEKECEILESNLSDGPATSISNTESAPASSSAHPTQTSSSSNIMNSIPITAPGVGTQTTKVDLSVKTTPTANSRAPFDVPVEKVESPGQSPFGKFQGLTFDIQGHSSVVTGMFIRDLDQEITKYESKIKELKEGAFSAADPSQAPKTHTELKALEDAFKIIKAGQQYRTHWILQKAQYEKNFGNKKQPPVLSFATALNQEQEILNKNIEKIIDIAKRVEELHELKNKWIIACNELKEAGQAESDRGVLLNTQINNAQEAINQYLQFAETIRDKDIIEKDSPRKPSLMATAKKAKETGHANYSSVLKFEANEQRDDYKRQAVEAGTHENWDQFRQYQDAAKAAKAAAKQFEQASNAGISEDAQNAYNLSGRYYLQQVQAILQENETEAKRYNNAAWATSSAANQFQEATRNGIPEEEKNARNLSAHYYLQQVQAILQENETEAKRYNNAAWATSSAANQFQKANKIRISADEKNAWNLSAHYYLQQAEAIIQGNEAEAERYKDAAKATSSAVDQFQYANRIGNSVDQKNAWNLSGRYWLQQAQAILQENEAEAKRYNNAAWAMNTAANQLQYANRILISEEEKNAWNLSGRYSLQQAEAIIEGNETEAKRYDDASQATSSAAGAFNEATSKRRSFIQKENSVWNFYHGRYEENRSEEEKNAWNLSGRIYLQQAQAIIQGNEAEAKQYRIAACAAESAASRFREAREDGISESQCSRLIQQGNDFLAQAEDLGGEIIQVKQELNSIAPEVQLKAEDREIKKQKEAEEQTKERYKNFHQTYNSRSDFKRGL